MTSGRAPGRWAPLAVGALAAMALAFGAAPRAVASPDSETAADVDLSADAAKTWFRTDWYAVTCDGHKVGWMRRALVRGEFGGTEAILREMEVHLDVAGDGNGVDTRTATAFSPAPGQALIGARVETAEQARSSWRELSRQGSTFAVTTARRGTKTHGTVPVADVSLADELCYERLALLAAARPEGPVGATLTVASMDLSTLRAVARTLACTAVRGEGAERAFEVAVGVGATQEKAWIDGAGGIEEGSLGGRFRYRRTSEEAAKDDATRTSLEELSRVPMDAKLDPVTAVRKLAVAWDDPKGRILFRTPRQTPTVQDRDGAGKSVVIEVKRDAEGEEVTSAAYNDALADDDGLCLRDPLLGHAAAGILSGTSERGPQVARLLDVVSHAFEKGVRLHTPTVVEILGELNAEKGPDAKRPVGDCTEHARLFVALCRVAGIPARTVEGLAWMGDDKGAFGWHQWAEVALLGRWVEVDPTSGTNPAPATNLRVDASPESRALLWGARFRLVSVDRDDPPPKRADAPK